MINILKKHDFPLRIERLFTRGSDPFDLVPWRDAELPESETAFEVPAHWSGEAAASFARSACPAIPSATKAAEENTVPSWLWRRQSAGKPDPKNKESSAKQIFHRIAGSAAYAGWKHGIFATEDEAQIFYDEIRYLLAQRYAGLAPSLLARAGIDWAYGIESKAQPASSAPPVSSFEAGKIGPSLEIRNASIDALLGGDAKIAGKWEKFVASGRAENYLGLRFADIASDWNAAPASAAAALDLFAFRRADGAIDLDHLAHAARLLAILLELLDGVSGANKAIGFHNLAPLLMSQGLSYAGEAGRATAAALAALIGAEACIASALMAGLLGPSLDFAANRETILRSLRNHRRAVYGDHSDYEKVSVLPAPLLLDPGADLALIAAARHRWDEALELTRQHGLRATQFTDLALPPSLAHFMESASAGITAMPELAIVQAVEPDLYRRGVHPAVIEALVKLGYDEKTREGIIAHIGGHGTLGNASGIDHAELRHKGFNDRALEEIENYLPQVDDIRLAVTPWIVGEEFCRDILKISADQLRDPSFNLLRALGFTDAAVDVANKHVYGCGSVRGVKALKPAHAAVLARADEIPAEAHIRMAASVQSFISGDAGPVLALDARSSAEDIESLFLTAWRQGLKSMTIEFIDRKPLAENRTERAAASETQGKPQTPPAKPAFGAPLRSTLRGKPKAQGKLVSLKRGRADKPDRPGKA